jgi:outer membrane protein TolC
MAICVFQIGTVWQKLSGFRLVVLIFLVLTNFSVKVFSQDLSYYIEKGKVNSPLIQDNKNQSEAARLEADRLRALYTKAQVSLTGTYTFAPVISRDNGQSKLDLNPSSAENYTGYDIAASNGGVYQGLLNINQPLFNGNRYKTSVEQTLIGGLINANTIQLTAHDLERFITDQYILCLQDYKQTEYLGNLINIINDQKNVISRLVENGIAKQSDLSLLIIEQKIQLTAFNTFKATYRRDLMDLRVLCGISDTTYQVLPAIDIQPTADITMSRFTERYRLDSLNLLAAQKVFELKYKPVVGAFANTGLNAVYAPTIADRFGLSAGINFSMNITDGKQKKIAQERTTVLMRSTTLYKNFFYNQNTVRKNRILTELKSIDERITLTDDQLKEYQKLLEFYKQELGRGQISVINYITVLKSMAVTQRDFVLLKTNKDLLINLYNYWNW